MHETLASLLHPIISERWSIFSHFIRHPLASTFPLSDLLIMSKRTHSLYVDPEDEPLSEKRQRLLSQGDPLPVIKVHSSHCYSSCRSNHPCNGMCNEFFCPCYWLTGNEQCDHKCGEVVPFCRVVYVEDTVDLMEDEEVIDLTGEDKQQE